MVFRVINVVLVLSIFYSCQNLSSNKNDTNLEHNVIDFSTVDVSPSFKNCEKLIDNEKTDCFRKTMQNEFTQLLDQKAFIAEKNIKETIIIVLHISKKGIIKIKQIQSSEEMKRQLPKLPEDLKSIVASLPKATPAIKRGIPVDVEYQLPIKIVTFDVN